MANLATFEIGKTYKMGWIGDSNLFTYYTVLKRTAKTVTVQNAKYTKEVKTCRIKIYDNSEYVSPTGVYSMSPVLKAEKLVDESAPKKGDTVLIKDMANTSFYSQVKGFVTDVRNGFVYIDAVSVMPKWSDKFFQHPSKLATSGRIEDTIII